LGKIPAELLKKMQAQEQSMGPRGFPVIPVGTYAATVSEQKSDVWDGNGYPSLRLAIQLHHTADEKYDGAILSGFQGWFASRKGPENTLSMRDKGVRNMFKQFLNSLAIQALSNPTGDSAVASDIWDINTDLVALGDDPDTAEVKNLLTGVAQIADGMDVLVKITQKPDNKDPSVIRNDYRLLVSPTGEDSTVEDMVEGTWAKYAVAAGLEEDVD
jgi:hypothetical protein